MSKVTSSAAQKKKKVSPEELLNVKLSRLSETLGDRDALSEAEMKQLEALSELVTLRKQHRPWWRRHKTYWFIAIVLLYGLAALILLRKQNAVTVQLEAIVSGLSFTTSNNAELATSGMRLSSLAFNRAVIALPNAFRSLPAEATENLKLETSDEGQGSIRLSDITLSAGHEVALRREAGMTGFRLEIFPTPTASLEPLRADVLGMVLALNQEINVGDRASGIEATATDSTSVDFILAASEPYELLDFKVPLESLSFKEVKTRAGLEQPYVDLVSTIHEGSVYIESLNKTYPLRSGQNLSFDGVENGFITSLQFLNDKQIKLQFRGTVSQLKTGFPDESINLMPTLWEWLQSKELALLVLGTFLTVLTLVLPFFRK
jgi:hypothetical protein